MFCKISEISINLRKCLVWSLYWIKDALKFVDVYTGAKNTYNTKVLHMKSTGMLLYGISSHHTGISSHIRF